MNYINYNNEERSSLIWIFEDKSKYTIINVLYEIFYDIKTVLFELFDNNEPLFIQNTLIELNEES